MDGGAAKEEYVRELEMKNQKIRELEVPYFSIDKVHLMYNAHPKLFRHSFWCIDNAHDAN